MTFEFMRTVIQAEGTIDSDRLIRSLIKIAAHTDIHCQYGHFP
jgi:hypothetical protein